MLDIRDRALALDVDCAIAARADGELEAAIEEMVRQDDENLFFGLVLLLLRQLT